MHDLVRPGGDDVLLDQHFDSIGDRLKKSERSNAVWAVTILHSAENFSLEHGHEREESQKTSDQCTDVNQTGSNLNQPIRRVTGQRRKQPFFCSDENLID